MAILQWNCRGFSSNRSDIDLLISRYGPEVLCLQETLLHHPCHPITGFCHYDLLASLDDRGRPHGGVAILVKTNIPHKEVQLTTSLKAIAIRVTLQKTITICSLYISPSSTVNTNDLNDLVQQLPSPFIILGDFNAHNPLWGGDTLDRRGRVIEKFISDHELCLWNDGQFTYTHPGYGTSTAIDLSICHPSVLLDYSWHRHEDTCGSDHYPLILKSLQEPLPDKVPTWQLQRADWKEFQRLCLAELVPLDFSVEDPIDLFTSTLISIALRTIPKSSSKLVRPPKPWFDDECRQSIRTRNRALNLVRRCPTPDNLADLRLCQARTRRLIKAKKKQSWRTYVSGLTARTPMRQTWNMIRKIIGRPTSPKHYHLHVNGHDVTEPKDIANTLGQTFSQHSSSSNYNPAFQRYQAKEERKVLDFSSSGHERYNSIISLKELEDAIHDAKNTSPGADDVVYPILKNLPSVCLKILLGLFNRIWQTNAFPPSWRKAIVVAIPKPNKDCSIPSNHRPIALTSCLCKTMERIINKRLVYYLENKNILTPFQCGFRQGRSTLDHLVRLETLIRNAFTAYQHFVAVFFDLEKAYDTTWKYGILRDLHNTGLRGNLPLFIQNFLDDRTFQVRLGTVLSDTHEQEMGVPQGSVLSVTLFSLKINSIVSCLSTGTDCSLYVDDFLISYRSSYMPAIERQLQLVLNKLEEWADQNGFRFSTAKTVAVHFCRKRLHPDPDLFLYGTRIPVVPETKFLGVTFDHKLTFRPHLKALKAKCKKALNILKVVGHFDWGADRQTLLALYRSLIRSKLDYGSIVYGSARKSYRTTLDPVHNQALRICLGALKTSRTTSLYVEANEPSLELRRTKLALQYILKLWAHPTNPAYDCVFDYGLEGLVRARKHVPPFGIFYKDDLENLNVDLNHILCVETPPFNPWEYSPPHIDTSLADGKKSLANPLELRQRFLELRDRLYKDRTEVFTDGSKSDHKVAAAAVADDQFLVCRLPNDSAVYSAELAALWLALKFTLESSNTKFVIFSDSLSCLQALHGSNLKNPLLVMVIEFYMEAASKGKDIVFCWVPSHVGISGNESADSTAKAALDLEGVHAKVPHTDFRGSIKQFIYDKWQLEWECERNNKLQAIHPTIGPWPHANRRIRREEVVLARLRIGHTRLTHTYIVKNEQPPRCDLCDQQLTVKHILIECGHLTRTRNRFYRARSMRDLFTNIDPSVILSFLKEIKVYDKL